MAKESTKKAPKKVAEKKDEKKENLEALKHELDPEEK